MIEFDKQYGVLCCGIDEAGRGPLAGPVAAACVHIPVEPDKFDFFSIITDSKKLSPKKRELLYPQITEHCYYGIAEASATEIDELNIHHATLLAMKRAYESMLSDFPVAPQMALIDGKFGPSLPCKTITVIKGDSQSLSIAAASILAKVHRDRIMAALHDEFPSYNWKKNSGYGTKEHLTALQDNGPTSHHRKSFAPLKNQ